MNPDPWRSKPGVGLGWCYCLLSLNGLDDQSLGMRVVDLTIILIEDSVSFLRGVWFMVSSHSHDDNRVSKV